jgi:hypothetical protein
MATKFEDAVAALKAQHFESPEMLQVLELMIEQNERIKNLENRSLANTHAVGVLDATQHSHGVSIGSLAADRDTHATRIAEISGKPAADSTKVTELEKRVAAVEGAVGSKSWKRVDPPKPVEAKGDPVTAKPGFFAGLTGASPADPTPPAGTP